MQFSLCVTCSVSRLRDWQKLWRLLCWCTFNEIKGYVKKKSMYLCKLYREINILKQWKFQCWSYYMLMSLSSLTSIKQQCELTGQGASCHAALYGFKALGFPVVVWHSWELMVRAHLCAQGCESPPTLPHNPLSLSLFMILYQYNCWETFITRTGRQWLFMIDYFLDSIQGEYVLSI